MKTLSRSGIVAVLAALCLALPAPTLAVDTTEPTISTIVRQSPTTSATAEASVTFRITFSEAVSSVDKTDFALAGTGAAKASVTSVTQITQDVYDLVAATADGTLYVVPRTTIDNIKDLAGNDYDDLVGSYETYTVGRLPIISIDAETLTDTQAVTDTEVVVTDDTAISTSGVTVHGSTTVSVTGFACTQTTTTKVTCTMTISGTGQLVIAATDAAGNSTTATEDDYEISDDIDVDRPDISFTDKVKGLILERRKRIYVTRTSVTFKGEATSLKGGKVKIYDDKDKLAEVTISSSTGKWSRSVALKNDKSYEIKFKFYDKHDRLIDTKGTYDIKVDSEKPKFDTMPARLTKRVGDRIWWGATDNDKIKRYRYQWLGKWTATTTGAFIVPSGSPLGEHRLILRAYDRAGNRVEKTMNVTVVR